MPPKTPPPESPLPQSPQYPDSQPAVPPYVPQTSPPGRSGLDRTNSPTLPCDKDEPCGPFSTCGRAPPCDGLAPCGILDYPCSRRKELLVKRPYKYKKYKYKAETTTCVKPFLTPTLSKFCVRTGASRGLICDTPNCTDAACFPQGTCATSSIFNEPTQPSDQICTREFKAPPLVLGYHPQPEVCKKSEPVVGLLSEDAPCRNCRCLFGPTISEFKCVSKMCAVKKGNSMMSPRTPKNMTSTASDTTKPGQSSLRLAIDNLTNVVMQLSSKINMLKGSGSSTSNKCRRRTCKYYTSS